MSTLFAVRHGQASFLSSDYDHLSDLGRRQSALLGRYWVETKVRIDRLITGPRRRQRDTAALVAEELAAANGAVPAIEAAEEFDEYQAEAVLEAALPALVENSEQVRTLQASFLAAETREEQLKTFQRMYEVVILGWANGEFDLSKHGVEPWTEFSDRVRRGLRRIAAESGSGSRVAVFTSGGPVGVAMQHALDLTHEHTLRLAWMVRNASFSEFLFTKNRITLSAFNAYPHLTEPELLTYR